MVKTYGCKKYGMGIARDVRGKTWTVYQRGWWVGRFDTLEAAKARAKEAITQQQRAS